MCAVLAIVSISAVVSAVFMLARHYVGRVFTDNADVLHLAATMSLIAAPFMWLDAIQAVGQGILRGCSMQTVGAVLAFVGFYCVSLPSLFTLAFVVGMGLRGLWSGV